MKRLLVCVIAMALTACSATAPSTNVAKNELTDAQLERMLNSEGAKKIGLQCVIKRQANSYLKKRECSTKEMRDRQQQLAQTTLARIQSGACGSNC